MKQDDLNNSPQTARPTEKRMKKVLKKNTLSDHVRIRVTIVLSHPGESMEVRHAGRRNCCGGDRTDCQPDSSSFNFALQMTSLGGQ